LIDKYKKEVTEGQGRRRKRLLDDSKETRGSWKLKEEALLRTLGAGFEIRLTT